MFNLMTPKNPRLGEDNSDNRTSTIFSRPPGVSTPRHKGATFKKEVGADEGKIHMLLVREAVVYASVRKMEWIIAAMMVHMGYLLIQPVRTFSNSTVFDIVSQYLTEQQWAVLFLLFGSVRLVVLFLNGVYIRQSAEVRIALSGISFLILSVWVWGFDALPIVSIGSAVFKWLAIGELANVWQASADRRRRLELRKNGHT